MLNFALGFATGFGTGYFTRELLRFGRSSLRPAVKVAVRGAFTATERVRWSLAHVAESLDDLLSEVRAEIAQPVSAASAASEIDDEQIETPVAVRTPAADPGLAAAGQSSARVGDAPRRKRAGTQG